MNVLRRSKYIIKSTIVTFVFCVCVKVYICLTSQEASLPTLLSSSHQDFRNENINKISATIEDTKSMFSLDVSHTSITKFRDKRCFTLLLRNKTLDVIKLWNLAKDDHVTDIVEVDRKYNRMDSKTRRLCNRFVMPGTPIGRIGNQMFEIASIIGMAYKYDMIPIIPENLPLHKYFNLPNKVNIDHEDLVNVVTCDCKKACVYYNCTDEFNSGANVSMRGYLQSWRYFEHAKSIIKKVFKIKTFHVRKAVKYIESIYKTGYQLVCIHVRRGDLATRYSFDVGYVIPNVSFIEKAKQFYVNKYTKVHFLVVSDDKAWCRENLRDVYISPFTDPGDDLTLMTLSDHVIVTAGSFGWWGAWLSGGTVVYFIGHQRPNSSLDLETNKGDYYPPSWIGMN